MPLPGRHNLSVCLWHFFSYCQSLLITRFLALLWRGKIDTLRRVRLDDRGSKNLWNVGKSLPDYTAQHPRRQSSSYSQPWEREISLVIYVLSWKTPSFTPTHCQTDSISYYPKLPFVSVCQCCYFWSHTVPQTSVNSQQRWITDGCPSVQSDLRSVTSWTVLVPVLITNILTIKSLFVYFGGVDTTQQPVCRRRCISMKKGDRVQRNGPSISQCLDNKQ
jgi:hypothetical protein